MKNSSLKYGFTLPTYFSSVSFDFHICLKRSGIGLPAKDINFYFRNQQYHRSGLGFKFKSFFSYDFYNVFFDECT